MTERTKTYKIALMGEGAVGKTSLRNRYLGKGFQSSHQMTIGADFSLKKITINDQEFMVQIWDLSGQPNFYEVRKHYYKGVSGMFLVFAANNLSTLDIIPDWINELRKNTSKANVPGVLIGNKTDLIDETDGETIRIKTKDKINEISDQFGMDLNYILTSAKTGENVELAFMTLIELLHANEIQ